jgi:hypothetical protein
MILGTTAAMMVPTSLQARAEGWYDSSVIIDALGSVRDPYSANGVLRLSDWAWT